MYGMTPVGVFFTAIFPLEINEQALCQQPQSVQKRGPVTSPSPFSCPAAPVRAAVSLSTRPAAP